MSQLIVVIVSGYFPHLGMLNQLITLSHQLNSDAFNLTNHKYMAHQTALLYVRYCLIKTLPKLSLFVFHIFLLARFHSQNFRK